jgi:hypothetical protein
VLVGVFVFVAFSLFVAGFIFLAEGTARKEAKRRSRRREVRMTTKLTVLVVLASRSATSSVARLSVCP